MSLPTSAARDRASLQIAPSFGARSFFRAPAVIGDRKVWLVRPALVKWPQILCTKSSLTQISVHSFQNAAGCSSSWPLPPVSHNAGENKINAIKDVGLGLDPAPSGVHRNITLKLLG